MGIEPGGGRGGFEANVIMIRKIVVKPRVFNAQMHKKIIFYYSLKAFRNYWKRQENVSEMETLKCLFNRP